MEFGAKANGRPGQGMEGGVAGAEAAAGLLAEARLQKPPDRALPHGRAAEHRGIVGQLADHSHPRLQAMSRAVIHQAAVNAVGRAGGTAGDVGGVDVEDVQRLVLPAFSSLRG